MPAVCTHHEFLPPVTPVLHWASGEGPPNTVSRAQQPVLERNTQQLLQDVRDLGIHFRAHVKTLKVNKSLYYLQTDIDSSSPRKSRA